MMKQTLVMTLLIATQLVQTGWAQQSEEQLARWLRKYPAADTNQDGKLTADEARAYQQKLRQGNAAKPANAKRRPGIQRTFTPDPGWFEERFPEHAMCYRTPAEIAAVFAASSGGKGKPKLASYPKPDDGSLRIVGTGHSFMAPGYRTFPQIVKAAGFNQPPLVTHTGGGMTGSTRYKWEQENGIFQFDNKPTPKLLAAISNAEWDVMLWGPYFQDRPEYYSCWIDFCLKYNPEMKFYLSDAWPQLGQLKEMPSQESELTDEVIQRLGDEKNEIYGGLIEQLNESYPNKVFILPTSDAMVLAAKCYNCGELPDVEGMHQAVGGKKDSLWRDPLGHLGPRFSALEGYVFYATVYGRSPELIEGDVSWAANDDAPSQALDHVFRRIAWEATVNNPHSGVRDTNKNGIDDQRE